MQVRRWVAGFVVCAALAVVPTARADVADYLGKTVLSVSVQSEGRRVTDARIVSLIETAVGAPLGMREVRDSITHLFSLAQYEDVLVRAALSEGGVSLLYELVPLHPVQIIAFSGAPPGVDEGKLRQLIEERFGRSPRAGRAADMARDIELAVREAGYLRARVTPRSEVEHAPERTSLTFVIDPGQRARVGAISVEGTGGLTQAELLSRLEVAAGEPYEPERLNARVERYLEDRRRKGFYEARLTVTPVFTDDDRTVNLRLTALQGPLVKVVYRGDPVPSERRDELVPVAREGSADEDLLEDSTIRIEEFFRAQGYRDAAAPHTREQVGDELVLTFDVRKGGQYRVESIDIAGNSALPAEELASRLRVRAGQPFSIAALDSDLTQLEEAYRRVGFVSARAEATTTPRPPAPDQHVPVEIRIQVTENVQTLVNSVIIEGNQAVASADLSGLLSLAPGQPFSTSKLAFDRDAIELKYANLGYQSVSVETRPGFSADSRRADVVFAVREGPRVFVDHVLIVGNDRTKTATIERELRFKAGDPLGLEAISESQRRLAAMGLFRRARITQLGRGDETRRDVLVTIEEAPLTTIGYGGGFEVRSRIVRSSEDPQVASEKLEFGPRASFEIGRRNLFGTNRSVNLFTSASLHPKDSPVFANQEPPIADSGGYGFPEYRVVGQFREPRVLRSNADFRVTGTVEQQIRSSFNFSRRSVAAELAVRLPHSMSASGGYQIQRTRVFNQSIEESQQPDIDRLFPKYRLSMFLGSLIRDTRDDAVDPTRGRYLSANGQLAARAIGSEVGFLKSFFTAQSFTTLPGRRSIVFATSARLGMAHGYYNVGPFGELPASERFFAGGDTTVRGFARDQLGVRHVPPRLTDTLDPGGFPLGGNALLLFNGELRVPMRSGLRTVLFTDVGNVYKTVSNFSFEEMRPAVGVGLRYKSPVGPVRFDIGFKVPRRGEETRTEWFITFGEAF
jgi:outer membrane protein assembly complex protein YaeT